MTEQDILALPAGPELDELIESEVFAAVPCDAWKPYLTTGHINTGCQHGITQCYPVGFPGASSTSIAVAWALIEAVCARVADDAPNGYWCRIETPWRESDPYHVGFTPKGATGWNGRPDYRAAADTMPLAACRAALLVAARTPQL